MNKGNLIVTVGISNSGKSTWAHERWMINPEKYTIVNRDKIRELLFGYTEETVSDYYELNSISKYEKQVTRYEDTLIHEGLNHGKTVIVDATNLTRKYLERFVYWNVPTEIMVFECDLKLAVERDLKRVRQVGDAVITKQYNRFISLMQHLSKDPIDFTITNIPMNPENTPVVIFDIDGTLAHMDRSEGGRSPYDWGRVGEDSVDISTVAMLDSVASLGGVNDIIICTGRDAESMGETAKWLAKNDIAYDKIYFRKAKDQRPDWIVKEEMWRKIAEDYNIVGMFDDRLQVVRRARALGLKVFNVEYSNF